ncbi:acyl carrier protein [Streptomyces sp. 5-8]|uniref:Acyl carrier protein n=1 Tax=Streptomyces musisoli TaxID=2802280 RepID=A0ABS1NSR4_9ACTN|nr:MULTISPECIES: acyl carrier protein [Streptomyces]MBL1103059.1 acyl carrier protein [Streptomyces musisoli]MBY8840959.1 acyl carrier protein [Streptomyces sp. SP2-10]
MTLDEVTPRIRTFIAESFLDGDPKGELTESTPLLEWEVLNSMNSALLLNFLREELRVEVPLASINAANFRDITSISKLVSGLTAVPAEGA